MYWSGSKQRTISPGLNFGTGTLLVRVAVAILFRWVLTAGHVIAGEHRARAFLLTTAESFEHQFFVSEKRNLKKFQTKNV